MCTDDDPKVGKSGKDKDENLVITPGGPRPRYLVHQVGPGEMVTHDKQGNPTVVPRKDERSKP